MTAMPASRRALLLSAVLSLLVWSVDARLEVCSDVATCLRGTSPKCVDRVCRYASCRAGFFYTSGSLAVRHQGIRSTLTAQCETCPVGTEQPTNGFTGAKCSPSTAQADSYVDILNLSAEQLAARDALLANSPGRRQVPFGQAGRERLAQPAAAIRDTRHMRCPPGPPGVALTACWFTMPMSGTRYGECVDTDTEVQACGRCGNDCAFETRRDGPTDSLRLGGRRRRVDLVRRGTMRGPLVRARLRPARQRLQGPQLLRSRTSTEPSRHVIAALSAMS